MQLALLLQGSSAALGFTSVTVLCEVISALGAEARVDEIRELYFQMRQSYTDTRFLLEEFFDSLIRMKLGERYKKKKKKEQTLIKLHYKFHHHPTVWRLYVPSLTKVT